MSELVSTVQDLCTSVVFGNGWLAGAGLALVAGIVVAVRTHGGIRV